MQTAASVSPRLVRFAWGVLALTVLVVLWGAVVRVTGSGAGCGEHWPQCNGAVLPELSQQKTVIEFSHRLTSGLSFLAVLALAWLAFKRRVQQPELWRWARASFVLMITESLIGAMLVLKGWVAMDASLFRALSMALHLINTFALLACLSLAALSAQRPALRVRFSAAPKHAQRLVVLSAILLLCTGVSGAIAALGDTLFRVSSLAEGAAQYTGEHVHFLIKLRTLHPLFAVITGLWLGHAGGTSARALRAEPGAEFGARAAIVLAACAVFQLGFGVLNLLLLAPIWAQLVHLLLTDVVLIAFSLCAAYLLREDRCAKKETVP